MTKAVESEWRVEPEGKERAGNHCRVGCGGRYFRGPGWRKPPRAGRSKALEKSKRDPQRVRGISPKRKVIRVESEETHDNVREERSTEFEEEEERTFIPSAASVPLKPLFRCDKQCSEKTLSNWQLASVVLNEGDEAYTTRLCQKCVNTPSGKRRKTAVKCAVETCSGKECVSRKNVEI